MNRRIVHNQMTKFVCGIKAITLRSFHTKKNIWLPARENASKRKSVPSS